MLNHIHLIIKSPDVAGFLRDFKQFTAKRIRRNIQENEPTIENIFLDAEGKFELWKKTNMPKLVETESFFLQKAEYMRANPVRKKYVMHPEDWYWSSANSNCKLKIDEIL